MKLGFNQTLLLSLFLRTMGSHGTPRLAMARHGRPWPAMAAHVKPPVKTGISLGFDWEPHLDTWGCDNALDLGSHTGSHSGSHGHAWLGRASHGRPYTLDDWPGANFHFFEFVGHWRPECSRDERHKIVGRWRQQRSRRQGQHAIRTAHRDSEKGYITGSPIIKG